jgi:predicted transposase/invertase (TIGR01784 family)
MSRYLDPKADVVFKKIFGEHPHLLKSFLNAVLPLPADGTIVELAYLPTESIPQLPTHKRTIADVRCTDERGRVFIVEMQIEWTDSFKQRLLFEAGQAFVKQIKKGEEYHLLEPVYGLGLVATTFDHQTPCWYHHYQLVNIEKPVREIIEHLQLVFIELPKFPVSSKDEKRLRLLWLRFMREINEGTVTVSPELLAVEEISEAVDLAQEASYTEAELQAYESYWDAVSTEKTLLIGRYEEGKAEGEQIGEARGKVEGEQNALRKVIRNLQAQGASLELIQAATGLTPAEIQAML